MHFRNADEYGRRDDKASVSVYDETRAIISGLILSRLRATFRVADAAGVGNCI
jgi:hypothetical protein